MQNEGKIDVFEGNGWGMSRSEGFERVAREAPPSSRSEVESAPTQVAVEAQPATVLEEASRDLSKAAAALEQAMRGGISIAGTHAVRKATDELSKARRRVDRALGVPTTHHLKTDPEPFELVMRRIKNYEIRVFDRDFQLGDWVRLQEFDRETKRYSGRAEPRRIVCITPPGSYGLPADVGVLGLE